MEEAKLAPFKSTNNWDILIKSLVTDAKALYATNVEDLEVVDCFFDFHDTKESPRKMQNPETDILVSKHAPNQHQQRLEDETVTGLINIPCPCDCFKYINKWCATLR